MLNGRIGAAELAELAQRNGAREWQLGLPDLRRLAALTAAGVARSSYGVTASARFSNGSEGFPVVQLQLTGTWPLVCQRCLGCVMHAVEIDGRLTVLSDDGQAAEVVDPFDSVTMTADELRLFDVIEDELLAALPVSPVHDLEMHCDREAKAATEPPDANARPNRPFSGLAELMQRSARDAGEI